MKEKTIVIIGGTGKIGKYVVARMQKEGFHTVCVSLNPLSDADKNIDAEYHVFNMTCLENIEKCCTVISERHSFIDGLINIIGKNRSSSLDEITEEAWNDVIDTNLKSVFFICRTFKKLFNLSIGGTIVNFSSTAGIRALPRSPHYIAAKAGVIALTEYFAQLFSPHIRVNCIAPGFVLTDNHNQDNYTNYNDVVERIPLHQMATIADIAEAVVYLLNAKNVTGHTLVIDGGLIL